MALIGGGRKREIEGLRARAAVLRRWIETCEQALEVCTGEAEEIQGYRAAQRVRGSLLQTELVGHRVELDGITAQIEALEAKAAGSRPRANAASPSPDGGDASDQARRGLLARLGVLRAGTSPGQRTPIRRRLVAGAIAGALLLLAVVLPVEHGLGLIPTLIATEEVIEVDPRTLGSAAYPTPKARPGR